MNNKNYQIYVKETGYSDKLLITAKTEQEAREQVQAMLERGSVPMDDMSYEFDIQIDGVVCSECENVFSHDQGAFKPDSEDTWLCDDCLASGE